MAFRKAGFAQFTKDLINIIYQLGWCILGAREISFRVSLITFRCAKVYSLLRSIGQDASLLGLHSARPIRLINLASLFKFFANAPNSVRV